MQALDPLWVFIEKLEAKSLKYMVTGSVASIFYGEPRLTHDIDLVLHLHTDELDQFEKLFPLDEFYCPPLEVIRIEINRHPYGHFNLIHHNTGFKADVYLEGGDPLHKWAFEKKRRITITNEKSLWLAPPEYIIIRKLEFYREGGADKHLKDLEGVLQQLNNQLDHKYLETQLKQRQLDTLWQKVVASYNS